MGCGASAPVIPFTAVIRGELANNAGQKVPSDSVLTGKIKLVLFSANVPQVKNFVLRLLAPLSTVLKAKGVEPFEVIFVSDDIEESAFTAYFAEMPSGWWAVPFTDASRRLSMHQVLGHLQGPLLAVIGANDELITKDGIQSVMNDPNGMDFPWHPKTDWGGMAGGLLED